MKLWHYTAAHHLSGGGGHAGPGILRNGILPTLHPYIDLRGGLVWLTDLDDWTQPWSTRPVPGTGCDRTEARVRVAVPRGHVLLRHWPDVRDFVLTADLRDDLERFADPGRWWVFNGRIPPGWLREVENRPNEAAA